MPARQTHTPSTAQKMNLQPNIELKILDQRIADQPPSFGTAFSAGMDVRACISEALTLEPGQCKLIPLGFAMHLADPGMMAILVPRSGLGHKNGIVLGNLVGILDADYTGQVMASCWNRSDQPFTITPLDRIAQMIVVPVVRPTFTVVEEFSATTERGAGGFGSTGKS